MAGIVSTRTPLETKQGLRTKKGKPDTTREPDIAFWFDEENDTLYLVRINEELKHIQLLQACFDLLAKAVRNDPNTSIGEMRVEE